MQCQEIDGRVEGQGTREVKEHADAPEGHSEEDLPTLTAGIKQQNA